MEKRFNGSWTGTCCGPHIKFPVHSSTFVNTYSWCVLIVLVLLASVLRKVKLLTEIWNLGCWLTFMLCLVTSFVWFSIYGIDNFIIIAFLHSESVRNKGVPMASCHDSIHITILNSWYDIIAILQDTVYGKRLKVFHCSLKS